MMLRSLLQDDPWCQRFQDTLTTLNRLWWLCWDVFISWVFFFWLCIDHGLWLPLFAVKVRGIPWDCLIWLWVDFVESIRNSPSSYEASRRSWRAWRSAGENERAASSCRILKKSSHQWWHHVFFEFALAALKTSREAFSWWIWHNAVRRRRGKRKQEINPEGAGLRGSLRSDFSIDMVTWCTMHSYLSKKKLSDGFQLCIFRYELWKAKCSMIILSLLECNIWRPSQLPVLIYQECWNGASEQGGSTTWPMASVGII